MMPHPPSGGACLVLSRQAAGQANPCPASPSRRACPFLKDGMGRSSKIFRLSLQQNGVGPIIYPAPPGLDLSTGAQPKEGRKNM